MAFAAKDFQLEDSALDAVLRAEVLAHQPEEGTLPQDELGYSDEMLVMLYQIAVDLSQEKQHDEAVAAFTFINALNPHVAVFWIGLGVAHAYQQDFPAAAKAFAKAIQVDPSNTDGYMYAVKLQLDLKDKDAARRIIDDGRQRADHADNPDDWSEFLELASALESIMDEGE